MSAVAERASLRDFRLYWFGTGVSFVGSEITVVAVPLLAALTLHATPRQMGFLVAAETVPNLMAPLFAGPVVDRMRKRQVLLTADLVRAMLLFLVPILHVAGLLTVARLVMIALALGVFNVIGDIGYVALVPKLVPPAYLLKANGRLEATRSVAQVIGPGLGGLLVQALTAPVALVSDAVSYLVSGASLGAIRHQEERPETGSKGLRAYLMSVGEGIRAILSMPPVRLLAFGSGAFNFFSGGAAAVVVLFVVRELRISSGIFGVALAIGGLGGLVAAWKTDRIRSALGIRATMSTALVTASVGELVLVLAMPGTFVAVILLAVAQWVSTFGETLYVVTGITLRQQIIPPAMIGRVFASMRVLSRGTLPIGAIAIGSLASATSLRFAVLFAGAGQLITALTFTKFRYLFPDGGPDDDA